MDLIIIYFRETEVPTNAISYIAPCGRRLRNIVEVMNYLTETNLKLSLDLFDFDPWVNIFNEYVVSPDMVVMEVSVVYCVFIVSLIFLLILFTQN